MILDGEVVGVVEFFTLSSPRARRDAAATCSRRSASSSARSSDARRAQEQLERFFTMSGDLLCIASFDGHFTRVNASWHRILGYTTTELMSQPFIDLVHYEDREATVAQSPGSPKARRSRSSKTGTAARTARTGGSAGRRRRSSTSELIYAVAHDTTDRKMLEQQTQETLRMRNDFVSFVTHQLRTPLSGIKWMLELATETEDVEEKASYVGDARESADRLISLVNDLLDASRLESGKLQVSLEPVRLRQLTYEVLADVATLVREKDHELDIRGGLPDVTSDLQLLRQVILNLASNAIKYTPQGGRIEIRISPEAAPCTGPSGTAASASPRNRRSACSRSSSAPTTRTRSTPRAPASGCIS